MEGNTQLAVIFLLPLAGTFAGSLLTLFLRAPLLNVSTALSFTGGVMLVASFTSLILPGLELGSFLQVATGIVLGFLLMALFENFTPHEHILKGKEGFTYERINRLYLIVFAIIIHNVPEGLSVGISSAYAVKKGIETALAIAIQDIPEGFVVSIPIAMITGKVLISLWVGFISGLVETLFAVLGFALFEFFSNLLAIGLGFAGGAMVYITTKEVFPEAYAQGNHTMSTIAFLLGLLLMLFLDTSL